MRADRLANLLVEAERLEARRAARGLGQGQGESYVAGVHVREFASVGRSRRFPVFGKGWLHTTFSDLEADVLLNLCWDDETRSVREQVPMSVRRTVALAAGLGKRHPRTKKGGLKLMTLDFVVDHDSAPLPRAISVKPPAELGEPRVQTVLEIEKRYCPEAGWAFEISTGSKLSPVLTANLRLLSPLFFLQPPPEHAPDVVARTARAIWDRLERHVDSCPAQACVQVGVELGLPPGFCQNVALHQLATKRWSGDLRNPLHLERPLHIVAGPHWSGPDA